MQYRINLQAGVEQRQNFTGTTLVLLSIGDATSIDVKIELQGYAVEELRGVTRGLRVRSPGFTGAVFTSTVDTTLEVIVSAADISVQYQDGNTVNANVIGTVPVSVAATLPVSVAAPLAVIPDRGAPGNPQYVSGITYSDAPAVTLQDNAAVACSSVAAALVAADPDRRGLRFTNIGTDPVTIGFTGITWAKRCIVLSSGDSWVEERAANLAWAAICDATKTASVTVQEVIS